MHNCSHEQNYSVNNLTETATISSTADYLEPGILPNVGTGFIYADPSCEKFNIYIGGTDHFEAHIPQPIGSLHPNIAPYGEIIKCKDGEYIILAIGNDKQFNKLCAVLGISEIANDARFSNNAKRVQARQSLNQILSERLKTKSAMQWHNLFIKADVPAGKVLNIKEVFEDPIAKKMVLNEQIDGLETKRVKTIAFNTDFLSD